MHAKHTHDLQEGFTFSRGLTPACQNKLPQNGWGKISYLPIDNSTGNHPTMQCQAHDNKSC